MPTAVCYNQTFFNAVATNEDDINNRCHGDHNTSIFYLQKRDEQTTDRMKLSNTHCFLHAKLIVQETHLQTQTRTIPNYADTTAGISLIIMAKTHDFVIKSSELQRHQTV